jgi:hypothetical protein
VGTVDTLPVWDQIEALFLGYTGRDATEAQLFGPWYALYDHIVSAGQPPDQALYQIANDFADTPAAEALYPHVSTPIAHPASPAAHHRVATIVDQVWQDLFGHGPSAAASDYWEHRVLSGAVPLSELPARIENHAHGANATTLLDHIHAAVYAATYFSFEVDITLSLNNLSNVALSANLAALMTPGAAINVDGGAGTLDVAGFTTGATVGANVLNFSVGASGLTGGTLAAGSVAAGADAVIGAQTAGSHVASDVTLVEITDQSFANAGALATALEGSEHLIFSGVPAAGSSGGPTPQDASHILVAYNDGTGSTRIANVGVMGSSPDTHYDAITGSDLVQLSGVSVTSLNAHNIHFLA